MTKTVLVFPGVGSLSSDVTKLRSVAERSSFYASFHDRLAKRHGVSLDEAWDRAVAGPEAVTAFDEIALQMLVQLAGAEIARWTLSEESSIVCVGHSIGEIAAAVFAGHLSVEEGVDVAVKLAEVAERVRGGGLVYGPLPRGERAASINFTDAHGSRIGAIAVLEADAVPLAKDCKRVHTKYPWHHLCYRDHAASARFGDLKISDKDPKSLLKLLVSSTGGLAADLGPDFWSRWTWNGVDLEAALSHLRGQETPQAVVEVGAHPMLQSALRAALPGTPHVHLFDRPSGFNAAGRGLLIRLCSAGQPQRLTEILSRSFPGLHLDHSKTWIENGLSSADLVPAATKLATAGAFPGLRPQDFFRFVTPRSLLEGEVSANGAGSASAGITNGAEVVIRAMSCLFPGNLASPAQLAGFTQAQGDAVRSDPSFDGGKQPAGYLGEIAIDCAKFEVSKSEIATLDPQQALVLNCVDKLLSENASIGQLPTETGVYIGTWNGEFEGDRNSVFYPTGTNPSLLAARVSHVYRLSGPSKVINTACASSLDAILEAFRAIKSGVCDTAIAGGVNLLWDAEFSQCMKQSGFLAPGGRCRTFDGSADGYVRSEGCGLVLLTRKDLCPNGHYFAEVLGGAANHNAGRSASITAPSPQAQEECINKALKDAGVLPSQVDYLECHGTGTKLGDPIEYSALAKTYGASRDKRRPCFLASVKANIGHLESAAGVAGIIHATMVLVNDCVPRMANLQSLNPHLDLVEGLEIPTKRNAAGKGLRVAGVSSFGFGGSNVHLLVRRNDDLERIPLPCVSPAPTAAAAASTHIFRRPAFDQPKQVKTRGGLTQKEGSGDDSSSEEDDAIHSDLSQSFWDLVSDVTGNVDPEEKILVSGIDSLGLTELFLRIEQTLSVQAADLARYLGGEFTWADMEADVTGSGSAKKTRSKTKRPKIKTNGVRPPQQVKKPASTVSLEIPGKGGASSSALFETWPMPRYPDMIKTTHVGSLPRARAAEDQYRELDEVVQKQLDIGITYINDGEVGRGDYATAAMQRMTGFAYQDDTPAPQPQDLEEFHCVSCRFLFPAGLITLNKRVRTCNPVCVGEISYVGQARLEQQCEKVRETLRGNNAGLPGQAFWTSPSPGTMAMFFDNRAETLYPSYAAYVSAVGQAMAVEYRTIVACGFTLQVDCPDLAMSRHTKFKHLGLVAWKRVMDLHVRVLNKALEGIPRERVRVHLCWGNYSGTHHRDVDAEHVLPTAFQINAQGISFEGGNNRHAADHVLFAGLSVPKDKVLYPGVIDTSSTSVESPNLVCQRICNFAKIFGPSRVVACTDCGFATTAESQGIQAEVAWMKLRMLVAGARQASALFFPEVVPAFIPRPRMRVFYFCENLEMSGSKFCGGDLEYRLILTSELSGKDAAAVAAHVRLFVDVPFTFETDGTEAAEIFVKLLRSHLADGKRRNCPLYPSEDSSPAEIQQSLSQADMVLDTSACLPKKAYQVVVIGGGVVGLLAAKKLLDAGIDVCVFERESHVGGIWTTFANETSQVNSSEGSYRIFQEYRKRANRDHSSTSEVRADILLIANQLKAANRIFTNTGVRQVCPTSTRSPSGRKVYSLDLESGSAAIECQGVIMAVNDRVGKPRPIQWRNHETFAGQVIDGFGGDATKKKIDWVGKRVVIVGMGAFAVENARTALECGASHVTVLARRHGTICPKFIDYINFVHRKSASNTSAEDGAMDTANNSKNMFLWRKLYEESHASMPECWLGQIKHTGHTISVSDVWYVGHHLGLLETQVGEISHFTRDGVVLQQTQETKSIFGDQTDDCLIPCDILVRCTGFERNACLVPTISPYTTMSRINYLDENIMYLADAYIDDDAFNSFFGSSVVEMSKFFVMVYHFFFASASDKDRALLSDEFLDTGAVSIEKRAWSHYIAGANFLVNSSPEIKAKADDLVYRRYLDFVETQTVQEYIEANKREWNELHDLLAQSKIDSSCYLPYPDWDV